jgi:hypothetical protein
LFSGVFSFDSPAFLEKSLFVAVAVLYLHWFGNFTKSQKGYSFLIVIQKACARAKCKPAFGVAMCQGRGYGQLRK